MNLRPRSLSLSLNLATTNKVLILSSLLILSGCDISVKNIVQDLNGQSSNPGFSKDKVVENITSKERMEALNLTEGVDPSEKARRIYTAEIRSKFEEGDFASLEKIGQELAQSKEKYPDGNWKITSFYGGINNRFNTEDAGYSADADNYKKWLQEFPNSPIALTAYSSMLVSYAWEARGRGYANTVTQEGWRLMRQRLNAASNALKAAQETGKEDIVWYKIAIKVGIGQQWDKNEFNEIVKRAVAKEPDYTPVLCDRAYSLLPRWYGEEGDWEKFSEKVADAYGPEKGDEIYTLIVIDLYDFYTDVFKETSIEWYRVKKGLESLIKKYPDGVSLKNHAAYLATLARDQEFANKCFESIGDSYIKWIWGKPERFIHFRGWARTGQW